MTDRLALADVIEEGGIERAKAVKIATAIFDAIHDNVATKADVQTAATASRGETTALRGEMLNGFARQDVSIERLRTTIADLRHDLVLRGVGALVAGLTALFAALRYWPPQG